MRKYLTIPNIRIEDDWPTADFATVNMEVMPSGQVSEINNIIRLELFGHECHQLGAVQIKFDTENEAFTITVFESQHTTKPLNTQTIIVRQKNGAVLNDHRNKRSK